MEGRGQPYLRDEQRLPSWGLGSHSRQGNSTCRGSEAGPVWLRLRGVWEARREVKEVGRDQVMKIHKLD